MKNLREIAKQYSVVFVGPVRNGEKHLNDVFKNIEKIGNLFKSYFCVFVESDSTDNTRKILESFAEKNDNIHNIFLGNLENHTRSRTVRIAIGRHNGIVFCENTGILDKVDYFIQIDMDDVCSQEIDDDAILSCFKYDVNTWDGMTANQNTYYDLWTLRKDGWLNYDCWFEVVNRPKYMSHTDAKNIFVDSRFIKIPKDYGLIEVDSAHGGLSIFKSSMAKGCRYKGYNTQTNFEESDLLEFNKNIKHKGGKIFINSEMINIKNN
jgi:glycosyltransferase involved in cell wall biosynthesis